MKKYFITGLLIWIPLVITMMVMAWIVGTLDQVLLLVPMRYRPDTVLGFHVPGLGVVLALFATLPYGKFVHGLYRYLALVKYAREKRGAVFVD